MQMNEHVTNKHVVVEFVTQNNILYIVTDNRGYTTSHTFS